MAAAPDNGMRKCFKCYYFYPGENLDSHMRKCKSVEGRVECPLCFCDYLSTEVEEHALNCKGLDDMVSFIAEHSRKIYSKNSIRKLITSLKQLFSEDLNGRTLLRTINEDKFNITNWVSFDDQPQIECPICMTEVPLDDLFVLSCPENHKVCYDCLYQHSLIKLDNNSALTCPNEKCNSIIHVNELKTLPFPNHVVNKLSGRYGKQLFNSFIQNAKGAIKCPNGNCDWVAMIDAKERLNICCKKCQTDFCSICRARSHYRVECNDIAKVQQEWMVWCNMGRDARRRQREKTNQEVAKYEKQRAANQERNEELRRNFEQLKKDENYKVQNCRLCPTCKRVVEKIDGCDLMICGQNYHGGDNQNGCGSKFNWKNALPYLSKLENQPKLENLMMKAPKQAENVNHYPYTCDSCGENIVGIRFECINCACANFCENCEDEQTLLHQNGHLFKLVTK